VPATHCAAAGALVAQPVAHVVVVVPGSQLPLDEAVELDPPPELAAPLEPDAAPEAVADAVPPAEPEMLPDPGCARPEDDPDVAPEPCPPESPDPSPAGADVPHAAAEPATITKARADKRMRDTRAPPSTHRWPVIGPGAVSREVTET
jgi:hypothetical protein